MQYNGTFLFTTHSHPLPFSVVVQVGLGLLMAMAGVWLVLVVWLFRRLRDRHASTYEALGSPNLFWNNTLRSQWLFLRFLYSSRRHELGDESAFKVVGLLRVLLPLCTAFLITFVALVVGTLPA